jgi:hypothetical protein
MPWDRYVVRRWNLRLWSAGLETVFCSHRLTSVVIFPADRTSTMDPSVKGSNPISAKKTENSNSLCTFSWDFGKAGKMGGMPKRKRVLTPVCGRVPAAWHD